MKKNEFWLPALFLATVLFLFVIPIGAFLVSEILGWGKGVYSVLTDLGSLIAGIIAVIGVAWMVYTQKSETAKIIKSNEDVMRNEAFEIKKARAFDSYLKIRCFVEELQAEHHYGSTLTPADGVVMYREVRDLLLYLDYFLMDSDEELIFYIDSIREYFKYYTINEERREEAVIRTLLHFEALNSIDGHSTDGFFCTMDEDVFVMMPKELLKTFREYIPCDISRYLTDYMDMVVLVNLARIIESQSLS